MTDSQPAQDEPTGSSGSTPPPADGTSGDGPSATAAGILESLRDALDDFAERATPTVKEYSAKAAELTASAADKAAPLARKAGEATADASGKLAERSRAWASELRAALGGDAAKPTPGGEEAAAADAPPATDPADPEHPA